MTHEKTPLTRQWALLRANGLTRRSFLTWAMATAAMGCSSISNEEHTDANGVDGDGVGVDGWVEDTGPSYVDVPVPSLPADPFTLGVASGDPLEDRVILWTRLAPEPIAGGGMPEVDAPVIWEISLDQTFSQIVGSGIALAESTFGHSVHVDADGLSPDTWYWYRFHIGEYTSPVGRTRTLPTKDAPADEFHFVVASCQSWKDGYYTPYPHIADEDISLLFFVGDYIYESGQSGTIRDHEAGSPHTLEEYRNRYAHYKSDPGLQAAHGHVPWVVSWDDHEVLNNYAGRYGGASKDPVAFLERRAAAYQAYYEHQPIRLSSDVEGEYQIYRQFTVGDLVSFFVLDTRQYRTPQACDGELGPPCDELQDPEQEFLGQEQEEWLQEGLANSNTLWNALTQQVVMTATDFQGTLVNPDQWDGYPVVRQRLTSFLDEAGISHAVVLSGDIHAGGVGRITLDASDPESKQVATEFVSTSISSGAYLDASLNNLLPLLLPNMPQIQHLDLGHRGYLRCSVTHEYWQADLKTVETVEEPTSPVETSVTYRIDANDPEAGAFLVE